MDIKIQNIAETDIPTVIDLVHEFAAFENLTEYCTITTERLHAAMFSEDANVEGLIARDGSKAVGYALFYPNFSSFQGQRGLYLDDIYVTGEYRKNGVGEAIFKKIAGIAALRGFERIDFQVLDWNTPALTFYKKLGAVSNDDETHFKFAGEVFEQLSRS